MEQQVTEQVTEQAPAQVEQIEPAQIDDIDDALSAAFDKVTNGEDLVDEASDATEAEKHAQVEETPSESENPEQQAEEKPAEEAEAQPVKMPESLPEGSEEAWNALDPKAQEFIVSREGQTMEVMKQLLPDYDEHQKLKPILQEFAEDFKANNATHETGIRQLLAVNRQLMQDPQKTILALAKQFDVDLGKAIYPDLAEMGIDFNGAEQNEQVSALQKQLEETKQEFEQFKQAQQQAQQQTEAQTQQYYESQLSQWAADKEHFEDVKFEMMALYQNIPANTDPVKGLDMAYEQACRANPKVFEKLQAQNSEKEAQQKAEKAKLATQKAADAAALNVQSQTEVDPTAAEDLDDLLGRTFNQIQRRN